jgi:hypothetical protein
MALNRLFVLAYSNERVAINLPTEDRRWFVIWSDAGRMSSAESVGLWAWYKAGGMSRVAAWLHQRDVSAFNPGLPPMMTEAKAIMVEAGMSGAESFLVELMRARIGEFSRGVVGAPWHALCDRLQGSAPGAIKVVQGALLHALKEAGYPAKADPAKIDKLTIIGILTILVIYVTMVYGPIAAMLVEMFPAAIRYTSMSLPYHLGNGWFGGFLPTTSFAMVAASGDIYYGLWYPVVVAGLTFVIGFFFIRETRNADIDA